MTPRPAVQDIPESQLTAIADAALVEWASWINRGRPLPTLDYGESVLARAMRSMPGTRCPTCQGRGGIDRAKCPVCNGAGRVRLNKPDGRANPAFITAQGGRPAPPAAPAVVRQIDAAVWREPIGTRVVVFVEYHRRPGRALDERVAAANRWLRRNGAREIAERTYQGRLTAFRRRLAAELIERARVTRFEKVGAGG